MPSWLAAVVGMLALVPAAPGADLPEPVVACLACHEDKESTLPLDDGTQMSLYVDADTYAGSVHGKILQCTDCHEGYQEGHPKGATFPSHRAYTQASYELCKKCHFETYTRTLESAHYAALKKGNPNVPVCADCHGAHDIQNPHEKQAMLSRSCAHCHSTVYEEYAKSVHGKALTQDHIQDVPACADCHTAHSAQDPGTAKFHIASPQICIGCHADPQRMAPYGISTDVATTYLADFHGVTAALADPNTIAERQLVVTCIDCHGVHTIASPKQVGPDAMKATVQRACGKCHQNAATDFPAAWLSHFQPSLSHAPLVYLIDLTYKIAIPFLVIGLGLQVLLHLYRVAIRR